LDSRAFCRNNLAMSNAHEVSAPHPEASHAAPAPPTKRANEKYAIVVGASSGMGAALVRQLAREGVDVVALARRKAQLDELAASCAGAPGRVIVIEHDVSRFEDVPALFERSVRELGGLDLFVYAAGLMSDVGAQEYDTAKDLDMLAVNVGG